MRVGGWLIVIVTRSDPSNNVTQSSYDYQHAWYVHLYTEDMGCRRRGPLGPLNSGESHLKKYCISLLLLSVYLQAMSLGFIENVVLTKK